MGKNSISFFLLALRAVLQFFISLSTLVTHKLYDKQYDNV